MNVESFVSGQNVIVTGGGGSIGSEICRYLLDLQVGGLLIVENSEPALYKILEELNNPKVEGRLADIRDHERINKLFYDFIPKLVVHAAALKHVPYLEQDWQEAIKTNVLGTVNVVNATLESDAAVMVNISSDKAVDPVSILGKTKAVAEMYCAAVDQDIAGNQRFISVRFGNVMESSGSVIPKFRKQIAEGGPVTVTHDEVSRYFMTVGQAAGLVLKAAGHAYEVPESEESIYVLDMGEPVRIKELAEQMIDGRNIPIVVTGLRPGERLTELLFWPEENKISTGLNGITAVSNKPVSLTRANKLVSALEQSLHYDEVPWQLNSLR